MANFHFFTEHANLTEQTDLDAFGPISQNEYRAASVFYSSQQCKAIACQSGRIIVQQSTESPDLVNVVLQPTDELEHHIKPQYYVYRGILKASLISGANILSPGLGTSEFIGRYHSQSPTEFGAHFLGYNSSLSDSVRLEDLFASPEPNFYTSQVIGGEWFGMFGNPAPNNQFLIALETIVDSKLLEFNLAYIRSSQYVLETGSLTGLALRRKREEILAYIDYAALLGSLYEKGVTLISFSNDEKTATTLKKQEIYNSILDNCFATKNSVYLDIRSEKGYSYNFYQNYGDSTTGNDFDLVFGGGSGNGQTTYQTDGWPILSINENQGNNALNRITFRLRIDDNRRPIIYLDDPKKSDKANYGNFIVSGPILNGSSVDWSNELTLSYRNVQVSTNRPNIANYIRLYYFRQQTDFAEPDSVLDYNKYYNGSFGPVDFDGDTFRNVHPVYVREPMNDDGTGNFGFVAESGAFKDGDRTIFYSNYNGIGKPVFSGKQYLPTYEKKLEIANRDYQSSLRSRVHTIVREYPITGSSPRRIPGINAFFEGEVLKEKEDAMLLGLTNDELDAVRAAAGLSSAHERFFYLEPSAGNPHTDTGNRRFYEFTLRLQGLNLTGERTFVTPQVAGAPLTLYSRDMVFFSTDAFGQMEKTSDGDNRIQFHIYSDGVVKLNDNIDLSLVRKSLIDGRDGLIDDGSILNDSSEVSTIHYLYHDNNQLNGIELCALNLVMANKMARRLGNNGIIGTVPGGFVQFIDYNIPTPVNGVDADISYKNDVGDIVTTGSLSTRRYNNQNKKVFMVRIESDEINSSILIDPDGSEDKFLFTQTLRYFGEPSCVAALIGALVQTNHNIESTGLSYGDGSCYPSAEHVNGLAIDTLYSTNNQDVTFIVNLHYFGFRLFRIGLHKTALRDLLGDYSELDGLIRSDTHNIPGLSVSLHDSHLHSTNVVLNDGFKFIPT